MSNISRGKDAGAAGRGRGRSDVEAVTEGIRSLRVGVPPPQPPPVLYPPEMLPIPVNDDSTMVYFDLETTGLARTSHIVQLAALRGGDGGESFNLYVIPKRRIDDDAQRITGITYDATTRQMYKHGHPVDSVSITLALRQFVQFLKRQGERGNVSNTPSSSSSFEGASSVATSPPSPPSSPSSFSGAKVILLGHNAKNFDCPILLNAARACDMVQALDEVILGFVDTLSLLREAHPRLKSHALGRLHEHFTSTREREKNEREKKDREDLKEKEEKDKKVEEKGKKDKQDRAGSPRVRGGDAAAVAATATAITTSAATAANNNNNDSRGGNRNTNNSKDGNPERSATNTTEADQESKPSHRHTQQQPQQQPQPQPPPQQHDHDDSSEVEVVSRSDQMDPISDQMNPRSDQVNPRSDQVNPRSDQMVPGSEQAVDPNQLHDASEDVKALQQVVTQSSVMTSSGHLSWPSLSRHSFSLACALENLDYGREKARFMSSWLPLVDEKVVSRYIADKASGSGLGFDVVTSAFQAGGREGAMRVMKEMVWKERGGRGGRWARVTEKTAILESILGYLQLHAGGGGDVALTQQQQQQQ